MKKLSMLIAVIMIFTALLSLSVFADPYEIIPNDPVQMPYASPVIDAVIDENEGWSAPALFDNPTVGYFWAHQTLTTSADLYFAYDEKGIYVGADIIERDYVNAIDQNGNPADYVGNYFIPSTGEDDINPNGDKNDYGWNGDVFIFAIDPLGQFNEMGFMANSDYTAWYCIGLFEDGSSRMYRSKVNYGEITNQVKLGAKTTENGWVLEAFIPWDIVCKDAEDLGFGDINVTEEDMVKLGATSRATVMYMDRFFDVEGEIVDTWGRYIIVPPQTAAGIPGPSSSGDCVCAYGLTLVNAGDGSAQDVTDNTGGGNDTTAPNDTTAAPDSSENTTDTAKSEAGEKNDSVTTKAPVSTKAPTTNKNTSTTAKNNTSSSAQTFDAGIAVAIGVLAVSAVGIVYIKKRR